MNRHLIRFRFSVGPLYWLDFARRYLRVWSR